MLWMKLQIWMSRQRKSLNSPKLPFCECSLLCRVKVVSVPRDGVENRWQLGLLDIRDTMGVNRCIGEHPLGIKIFDSRYPRSLITSCAMPRIRRYASCEPET